MTRYQSQGMYGFLIVITGGIIAALSYNPSRIIQYILSGGIFLSAGFAFITAVKSKNSGSLLKYHQLQGAGMVAYALAILVFGPTFEKFITVTMAFLLYFGITEVIFGFQLMEFKTKTSIPIITLRMITGFFMAVGAVVILATAFSDKNMSLLFSGILIALSGTNFILFANASRKLVSPG